MDRQPAGAGGKFSAVADQWARQVRAYRQSVALFREVGALRARRRRNVQTVSSIVQPAPPADRFGATPTPSPTLRLLPSNDAPADESATATACPLTQRQLEVVELISRGMTNVQIARELVLTSGTVANHIEHILRRLDVPNRAAAATWLTRERPRLGLVPRSSQSACEVSGRD